MTSLQKTNTNYVLNVELLQNNFLGYLNANFIIFFARSAIHGSTLHFLFLKSLQLEARAVSAPSHFCCSFLINVMSQN